MLERIRSGKNFLVVFEWKEHIWEVRSFAFVGMEIESGMHSLNS